MTKELVKTCGFCNEIDVNMKEIIICKKCKDHIINTSKEFKYWSPIYYINELEKVNYIAKEIGFKVDSDIIKSILNIEEEFLSIRRWLRVVKDLKDENIILDYINNDGETLKDVLFNSIHKEFMNCD